MDTNSHFLVAIRRCVLVALYVASSEAGAGKTAICAGVGKHLRDNGSKVGFLKVTTTDKAVDSDAAFMKGFLALEEPIDSVCPVITDQNNMTSKIKGAYDKVSPGKDVVIIEGAGEQSTGEDSHKLVEAMDARVIIVVAYSKKLSQTVSSYKDFGERLLGIVVNKAPGSQLERVHSELSTQFGEAGVSILGVLPEDRVLFTLTVGELAEHLGGEILNGNEKSVELVENVMLGAMAIDPGLEYFGRKTSKAVVVRGERADMQLAALETSTRCLVLSGDAPPNPVVLRRAEDKKVPIILAKEDVIAIVARIEEALDKARFNQEKKVPKLTGIMEQHFNFPAVYQGLGLAK